MGVFRPRSNQELVTAALTHHVEKEQGKDDVSCIQCPGVFFNMVVHRMKMHKTLCPLCMDFPRGHKDCFDIFYGKKK